MTDGWKLGIVAVASLATSCAPRPPSLPADAGTPYSGFASAYSQATVSCQHVTSITVSMALSGRAGSTKLRGRIDAGFAAPARARLEGIPPFGKPVFVLVADGPRATLILTRDDRVLRDAPADRIVEALAGVALDAAALRTIVSGCGFGGDVSSTAARAFSNGWVSAPSSDGVVYLRHAGAGWTIAAATRGRLAVIYADEAGGRPMTIRLRDAADGHATADLTLRLSDVDVNTTLDPKTFEAELPAHPIPLTLEELRRAGPLGG